MSNLEQRYQELLSEWVAIGVPDGASLVDRWERAFAEMKGEQVELADRGQWVSGRSDLLGVLGRGRREVHHTTILGWLLDPAMPHPLGTRFLERFLRRCCPWRTFAGPELSSVRVRCEECREHGRADLVVLADHLTVVVEAKVDHVERPRQCDDLYRDYGDEPGIAFAFLTPDGARPTTATGAAAEAFVTVSFTDVRDDLRAALAEAGEAASSGPAHGSVISYLQTLDAEF
jgi:hypothetical protein